MFEPPAPKRGSVHCSLLSRCSSFPGRMVFLSRLGHSDPKGDLKLSILKWLSEVDIGIDSRQFNVSALKAVECIITDPIVSSPNPLCCLNPTANWHFRAESPVYSKTKHLSLQRGSTQSETVTWCCHRDWARQSMAQGMCRAALWCSRSSCSQGFWCALSWWWGPEGELCHPGRPPTPRAGLPQQDRAATTGQSASHEQHAPTFVCAARPSTSPQWLLTDIYFSTWHIEH